MQLKTREKIILKRHDERIGRKKEIRKYRFVTDFEPSFPSIKTAFKKFKNIIEEDEDYKKISQGNQTLPGVTKKEDKKILKRCWHLPL